MGEKWHKSTSGTQTGKARKSTESGVRGAGHGEQRSPERRPAKSGPGKTRGDGPQIPDDVDISQVDKEVRSQLRALPKDTAARVLGHLAAADELLADDPAQALLHAQVARGIASRFAVVREAVGIAAYYAEEWQTALVELRTARRLSGSAEYLAMMADCERALGRIDKAHETVREGLSSVKEPGIRAELCIVESGMCQDAGEWDAALAVLDIPELQWNQPAPWLARLRYAYAEALMSQGNTSVARDWFVRAAEVDTEQQTDAAERVMEFDGIVFTPASEETDSVGFVDEADADNVAPRAEIGGTMTHEAS